MSSFIADVQRIRETFGDADSSADARAATPVRSDDVEMAQPIPGAYAATPSPGEYEHKGIWCDSCNQKVYGTRHKCLDCYNFDLCNPCYTTKDIQSTHADMPHTFEAIHPPQAKPKAPVATKAPSASQPHCLCSVLPRPHGCSVCKSRATKGKSVLPTVSYRCDSCKAIIAGTRHRCMSCPDFDLCEGCYVSGSTALDHSRSHRFMHVEHPIRIITAPAISANSTSPVCAGACIHEGPRYKCENCDALDLCVNCLGDVEKATIEHSAFHAIQDSDQVVRFVPYTKEPQKPSSAVIHPADCDACDKTIVGTRHKCTVCLDFDLCDTCFALRAEPLQHKSDHEMVHLDHPQRIRVHTVGPQTGSAPTRVPTAPAPSTVHNAWCDNCTERIRGVRHKCLDCEDFDFCDACRGREHFNGTHQFYAFVEPGEVIVRNVDNVPTPGLRARGRPNPPASLVPPPVPAPPAPMQPPSHHQPRPARPSRPTASGTHSAACDMCSSRIRGVRYKCTVCPDYDVCESCFRVSEDVHPTHSFAKVYNQGDIVIRKSPQASFRHHARCDVCQNQIMGVRYKCLHPSCADFDICERCEAMPFPVHPETHALLKLRSHISNYDGLKTVLSFASRGQVPQPPALQVPAPVVRIPSPRVQIPTPHMHRSPIGTSVEPSAAMDIFHTAAPSPVVPLSTLGCTIVPHTTIVASLPQSPAPEPMRLSPQTLTPPVIPSPPAIPASLLPLVPERKLSDSVASVSTSSKLDEHKSHHSDMYKPSYEVPSVVSRTVVEEPKPVVVEQDQVAFLNRIAAQASSSSASSSHGVTVAEERDPEAPEMTLLNTRPISVPSIAEPVAVVEAVPEPVVVPERVETPTAELPSLLSAYPYQAASSGLRSPVSVISVSSESSTASSVSALSVVSVLDADFVEDRSIVDGQIVSGGAEFAKCWRMRNTGPVAWPAGTTISFVGGNSMLVEPDMIHWAVTGDLSPGQDVDLEVDMKAPEEPGRYVSYWRLKTPDGEAFGARIWCDIIVAEMERAGSSGSSEISASSIVLPAHAPGMSAVSVDTATASPTIHSVPSTVHTASIADTADIESLGSLDSDDSSDDSVVWEEVRRQTLAAQAQAQAQAPSQAGGRSEGDRFEMVYESD